MSGEPGHDPAGLTEGSLGPDPIAALRAWLEEARAAGVVFPEAAALATADAEGRPAVRHVLVKGIGEKGLTFHTNRESRKGRHLAENPNAAIALYWRELDRQVTAEGPVRRMSDEESLAYFRTRPREARIGAWASRQSRPVASRQALDAAFAELDARFPGDDVPLPPALGRLPPRTRDGGVLEGARAPPPRPVPIHARWRRLAARTPLAVDIRPSGIVPGPMNTEDLRDAIANDQARAVEELSNLVHIPSIAFPGYDDKPVRASAEATAGILEAAGYGGVRLIELPGVDHPAVFGEVAGPAGAPTVLLYAHHDVQPEGPLEEWTSPPFEPEVRDGRLFGRGTSDDKCGVVMHAAALRAWGGKPPVTVKVLVEGEEEATAEHLPFLIEGHRELLAADVIGVADGGNWRAGIPTLETSIRGVVDCVVTVRALDLAVHSGAYGGPAIDAISALARILTTLHDDEGQVAIEGLTHGPWEGLQLTEEEYREDTPLRPSVILVGSGSISERLWSKPAVAVLGLDAPRVVEASNQLVPVASAKVSLRLAPEEDAQRAMDLLTGHLAERAPWGVEVDVTPGTSGQGMRVKTDGPGFAAMDRAMETAFGREVVQSGSGGSVPLVPELSAALPDAEILMYGASDEMSQYHSIDESVDLGELERVTLAEALLFLELTRS